MHFFEHRQTDVTHTHIHYTLVHRAAGTHHLNYISILYFKIFINKCIIKYACCACSCAIVVSIVVVVVVMLNKNENFESRNKKLGKYMHILYAHIEPHTNAIYMHYNLSTRIRFLHCCVLV